MSRIREALVFEGGGEGIDTDKAARWGINRLWYEAGDPVASSSSLAAARKRGCGVGLKVNGTGAAAAQALDKALTAHGFSSATGPYTCGAMLDDELHDEGGTLAAYKTFRLARRTRYFVLTFEPFQGGALPDELIALVNADPNTVLAPFLYMTIAGDELYPAEERAVIDDLLAHGVAENRIAPFISVSSPVKIPYGWAGYLYGFAQLPDSPPAAL